MKRCAAGGVFVLLLSLALIAALVPVNYDSRQELFEIPHGTWAQRMSGDPIDILPQRIYLALGVRDILVLKNLDEVPQMFGPTLIMPGQSFTLPFNLATEHQFACSAHVDGQMTVVVDPEPTPGWLRLQWRMKNLLRLFMAVG